jgi:saccharopine dehydrogenase-like NADP-dependent oxidoreductase
MTKRVLVLGTGHIGRSVAHMLRTAQGGPHYDVWVGDRVISPEVRAEFPERCFEIDGSNVDSFARRIQGNDILVNALPFHLASTVAAAAAAERIHYFDLTEDVSATRTIRDLARDAKTAFMPQCGLAPGFIAIAGHALSQGFDKLERLHMRVGALPQYPTNALKYNLTWSVDGLINEYVHPCEATAGGL